MQVDKLKIFAQTSPAEVETLYRRHYLHEDSIQTSIVMLILAVPLVAFSYNDYRFLGLGMEFYAFVGVRLLLLAVLIATVVILLRNRSVRMYDWICVVWLVIGFIVVITIDFLRPQNYIGHTTMDVVMLLLVYLGIPMRLPVKYFALILFTVFVIMNLFNAKVAASWELYTIIFAFLVANITGILGSWQINVIRRREFHSDIEQQKAQDELKRLAEIDDLTGIYNTRVFNQIARNELQRFQRYGHPLIFIMLDLDDFKLVNDHYGHLMGDRVLKEVASTTKAKLRSIDVMGRLGGDEFGILLPETSMEKGKVVANRIQEALRRMKVATDGGQSLYVKASLGLTQAYSSDKNLDSIISRADSALYQAKREGGGPETAFGN